MAEPAELWRCPWCGRTFAARRQVHTCAPLGDLDRHFRAAEPRVRATFDAIIDAVGRCGRFEILPERTRIALHVRMSFVALMPRRRWLRGHLVLAQEVASPRFLEVQTFSPHNVLHLFRLDHPAEVDDEFCRWLAAAYDVGQQRPRH